MSYGIDVMFHKADNKLEAFELAQQAMKIIAENAQNIIENNMFYCPLSRMDAKNEGDPDRLYWKYDEAVHQCSRLWIRQLMTYRFMWWPNQKLLGVIGGDSCLEKFGWKGVYFQNSTDQDYEYSEWADICPAFDEIVEKCKNISSEQIQKEADEITLEDYDTDEAWAEHCDYQRRSAAYQDIFEMLDIESILYGYGKSDEFEYFAMNAIPDNDTYFSLELYARSLAKKYTD